MTIRSHIQEISIRLQQPDTVSPHEAAEMLVKLTALLSSLNSEITEKHYALNVVKVALLTQCKSVSEAKMKAESSSEWLEYKEREMQGKAVEQLIQALKYLIRRLEEEFKQTR